MFLQPKKIKFQKFFKPRKSDKIKNTNQNLEPKSTIITIALESGHLTGRQLEAARQSIRRKLKRKGQLRICLLPDLGISHKASSSRIGKGKGKVELWIGRVNPGKPIFILAGIPKKEGKEALKNGSNKLPIKTKIVYNSF
ncbi:unnamed protein product [Choristocarpus tenellus]|uniref:ribosomal protein L16 n=1 Tax=Choristocarpus tenellus TaxID=116065 RepID=UPI002E77027E|nr:ribosomal protein L16 [Choristocarpus tenellus]WBP69811.1 ribosomal protein L16 [Choristocarpus tenellus]